VSGSGYDPHPIATACENGLVNDVNPWLVAGQRAELPEDLFQDVQEFEALTRDRLANGAQGDRDRDEIMRRWRSGEISTEQRDLLFDRSREDIEKNEMQWEPIHQRVLKRIGERADDAMLPKLAPSRESPARDELQVAFSGDRDPRAVAVALAMNGSDEVVACLLTPFARTLLVARGIENVDAVLADVRQAAVARAMKLGTSPAAQLKAKYYAGMGALVGGAGIVARRNSRR
jgi:hypothetical protein